MSKSDNILPNTAPLTSDQVQVLNGFLPSLQPDQLLWMEGFISGLRAGKANPVTTAKTAIAAELTVLFGTESGNAESLADQTVKAAAKAGFKAKAVSMGDIKPAKLKGVKNLLIIVSTWGEGDPPENAIDFHKDFMSDQSLRLEGTRYSVLSLGDTSYEHFCKIGIDFDARLEALGAQRIFERKDCDVDFDEDYAIWQKSVLAAFSELTSVSTSSAAETLLVTPAATTVSYSRKNPFPSNLETRVLLNGKGSSKETIHLEFDLEGSGLTYEAGDALAVIPANALDVVESILETTKLDGTSTVTLKEGDCTLHDALTHKLEITTITLPVLKRYNEFAQNADLDALIHPDNKPRFNDYINGRELIDILTDFPAKELTANGLAGALRKLPPRLYSIASSPKAHPGEVHLTVGVVRYHTNGRQRKGVCSSYLADRIQESETAKVFVSPNKHFKIPNDPDAPLIMVGPGTGIAPFRAFIEERQAIGAKGKNWLFFGDQHYLTDFLYQTEWQDYLSDGILTKLDVAFSRDQANKVYVQDRMRENAKELYNWLQEGATFCVCGEASRMAHDVDKALHDIVAQEGKISEDAATEYVKKLKADKRYLLDVY
jgi:sulfite reductase (NADPH) flavoprotein alpha-component